MKTSVAPEATGRNVPPRLIEFEKRAAKRFVAKKRRAGKNARQKKQFAKFDRSQAFYQPAAVTPRPTQIYNAAQFNQLPEIDMFDFGNPLLCHSTG